MVFKMRGYLAENKERPLILIANFSRFCVLSSSSYREIPSPLRSNGRPRFSLFRFPFSLFCFLVSGCRLVEFLREIDDLAGVMEDVGGHVLEDGEAVLEDGFAGVFHA